MGLFKYPYTDLNELNLDWVIAKIKYIEQAKHILFDNSGTPLVSNNVQDAIEEIYNMISTQGVTTWNGRSGVVVPEAHDYTGAQVDYDNTLSGLAATETQSAIDELAARPLGGVESFNSRTGAVVPTAGDYGASDVAYDNTGTGLTATDVQSAIDEVDNKIPATIVESFNTRTGAVLPATGDYEADDITYDNTVSGLTATDTQTAIDELDNRLDNFSVAASQVSYDNTQSGLTATDAQAALDEIANDVLSSGVASFNGRTGAVNPAAGDYDAADVTYDNTVSGLTATNTQNAIDEIAGSIDGNYVLVEDHVITNSNYTDTVDKRLYDLANAALTYLQGLSNDKIAMLETFVRSTDKGFIPANIGSSYTNTLTNFILNLTRTEVSASNNTFIFSMTISTVLQAYNVYKRISFSDTGTYGRVDYTSTTESVDYSIHFNIYKQI